MPQKRVEAENVGESGASRKLIDTKLKRRLKKIRLHIPKVQHIASALEATRMKRDAHVAVATNGCSGKLSLSSFKLEKVLSVNPSTKSLAMLGSFPDMDDRAAVILAEKTAFPVNKAGGLFRGKARYSHNFQNDIYGQYSSNTAGVKATVIYPATEKHVKKYSQQRSVLVQETAEAYAAKIRPYAEQQALSIQWVYNLLDGVAEVDRVVYNDADPETGFILLPDLKWEEKSIDDLYMLAIVRKRGILSLRELNTEHIPLLENVNSEGKRAISEKYAIPLNQIRAYIHYQPTYYHLHVHFTAVGNHAPGSTIGQAVLLDDVIDNIKRIAWDYYATRTLTYQLREDSPQLELLT